MVRTDLFHKINLKEICNSRQSRQMCVFFRGEIFQADDQVQMLMRSRNSKMTGTDEERARVESAKMSSDS